MSSRAGASMGAGCRWGWGGPGISPGTGAQSPEDPPVACALRRPEGAFRTPEGRVAGTCAAPTPAIRGTPSAGLRPVAPVAQPVVRPSRKSRVTLAAARGPARAAASRCRPSAGTPPSAPAWSARPGSGPPGAAVRPPRLHVRATLPGRWASAAAVARAWDPTPDPQNLEVWLLSILSTWAAPRFPSFWQEGWEKGLHSDQGLRAWSASRTGGEAPLPSPGSERPLPPGAALPWSRHRETQVRRGGLGGS